MSRIVPYNSDLICDDCGHKGAYDFMGDYLCQKCADKYIKNEDDDIEEDD